MSTPGTNHDELSHVEPDDIGVGMLVVVAALCAVALLLSVVLLQAWFYNWQDAVRTERSGPADAQSTPADIAADQLKRLDGYGWADKERRVRTIPISRAMALIVQEYGAKTGEKESNTK